MNTYVLTGAHDEGIHTVLVTKAEDIMKAIGYGFQFSPFSTESYIDIAVDRGVLTDEERIILWRMLSVLHFRTEELPAALASENSHTRGAANIRMVDELAGLPRSCLTVQARRVHSKLVPYMREHIKRYYNVGKHPNYDPRRTGNYVDGDSNSSYSIFEITPEGITIYPDGKVIESEVV